MHGWVYNGMDGWVDGWMGGWIVGIQWDVYIMCIQWDGDGYTSVGI